MCWKRPEFNISKDQIGTFTELIMRFYNVQQAW